MISKILREIANLIGKKMICFHQKKAALSQVSTDGIRSGRVCVPVQGRIVVDVCEILPCTDKAAENLVNQPEWRQ